MLNRADVLQATCDEEAEWICAYHPKAKGKVEQTDLKRFFDLSRTGVPPVREEERKRFLSLNGQDARSTVQDARSTVQDARSTAQDARSTKGDACPLHVLYLGRHDPLKGVRYLELAVADLNRTIGFDPAVQLRVVSNHSGAELEADWAWSDVLCLPTLSENFGRVVAEALERGKRVITTDGAPAWRTYFEQHPDAGIYLKGYRDGSEEMRVKLLADALRVWVVERAVE